LPPAKEFLNNKSYNEFASHFKRVSPKQKEPAFTLNASSFQTFIVPFHVPE
jgi:hypothetical protein